MKEKVYPGSLNVEGLASKLQDAFQSQGYQVQKLGSPENVIVQIKKGGTLRTIAGLDQALTVRMSKSGESTTVSLGQGKWIDKAVVGAVDYFVFMPLMGVAAYGLYEQHKLPGKVWQVIDDYASSQGVSHTKETTVSAVHCPQCGVTNAPDAKFCNACGAPLQA